MQVYGTCLGKVQGSGTVRPCRGQQVSMARDARRVDNGCRFLHAGSRRQFPSAIITPMQPRPPPHVPRDPIQIGSTGYQVILWFVGERSGDVATQLLLGHA